MHSMQLQLRVCQQECPAVAQITACMTLPSAEASATDAASVQQSEDLCNEDAKQDTSCAWPRSAAQPRSTDLDNEARLKAANSMMWWVLASGMPRLQPEQVLVACLYSRVEGLTSLELSRKMHAVQLGGVSHVANLFYTYENRFTPQEEAEDLRNIGEEYFWELGTLFDGVRAGWHTAMWWEHWCIEAGQSLCVEQAWSEDMLSDLEASLNASAGFEPVRAAAKALIQVSKYLEQLRRQHMQPCA